MNLEREEAFVVVKSINRQFAKMKQLLYMLCQVALKIQPLKFERKKIYSRQENSL